MRLVEQAEVKYDSFRERDDLGDDDTYLMIDTIRYCLVSIRDCKVLVKHARTTPGSFHYMAEYHCVVPDWSEQTSGILGQYLC